MIQMTKDVTIGGAIYQVGRLRPHVGSWLLSLLMTKMSKTRGERIGTQENDAEGNDGKPAPPTNESLMATATYLVANLDLEEQEQVQNLCLIRCARYEEIGGKHVAMPIMAGAGRWAIDELEYDGPTVLQLVRECLAFNIAPFFTAGESSSTT